MMKKNNYFINIVILQNNILHTQSILALMISNEFKNNVSYSNNNNNHNSNNMA